VPNIITRLWCSVGVEAEIDSKPDEFDLEQVFGRPETCSRSFKAVKFSAAVRPRI
jgi:hypothetical protein